MSKVRLAKKTIKVTDSTGTTIGLAQQVGDDGLIEIRLFPGEEYRVSTPIRTGDYSIDKKGRLSWG